MQNIFIDVSCADLRWNELVEIISKLNSLGLSLEDIEYLNYFEWRNISNSNAVVLARHFQNSVEIFFKKLLLIRAGPLGKAKYYAMRVEFQFRGSPQTHRFLWVPNAPTLNENSINAYVDFLDPVVCENLTSEPETSHLYQLVKTFQIYSHSRNVALNLAALLQKKE